MYCHPGFDSLYVMLDVHSLLLLIFLLWSLVDRRTTQSRGTRLWMSVLRNVKVICNANCIFPLL